MRLLIVEDESYGRIYAKELQTEFGHEVVCVTTPAAALAFLTDQRFDAAIVDMLFHAEIDAFDRRSVGRQNPLTAKFVASGLSVIHAARHAGVGTVIWTTEAQDRRLHIQFALEELGTRCICMKSSAERDSVRDLHVAATAAAEGREWTDPVSRIALPAPGARSLRATIMSEPSEKRAYWRALALGLTDAKQAKEVVGVRVRDLVAPMSRDLNELMPYRQQRGFAIRRAANARDLQIFAVENRTFFLDEAVREVFP